MATDANRKEFPGQRPNEHVIVILRRHWIVWFKYILQLVFFNVLPVVISIVLYFFVGWSPSPEGPIYIGLVFLLSTYYLGAWLMYFHAFIDYRLDSWVLTDQRIVNVEQQGMFDRVISELSVTKVQDVTSEVHGHMQTFLDYGNVYVQTAGEQQRFVFLNVPHPEEVARLVVKVNDAALQKQRQEAAEAAAHVQQQDHTQPAPNISRTEPETAPAITATQHEPTERF